MAHLPPKVPRRESTSSPSSGSGSETETEENSWAGLDVGVIAPPEPDRNFGPAPPGPAPLHVGYCEPLSASLGLDDIGLSAGEVDTSVPEVSVLGRKQQGSRPTYSSSQSSGLVLPQQACQELPQHDVEFDPSTADGLHYMSSNYTPAPGLHTVSVDHELQPLLPLVPSSDSTSSDASKLDDIFIGRNLGARDSDSDSEDSTFERDVAGMQVLDSSSSSSCSDSSEEDPHEIYKEDSSFYTGVLPDLPSDRLYPGAPISTAESFTSILSFAQSHKLSGVGFSDLLKLIQMHCPQPNQCLKSLDKVADFFSDFSSPMQSYFYCNLCLKERTSLTDKCDTCKNLNPSVDQIIVLSLVDQVSKFYERPGFLNEIQYRFQRTKLDINNYEDIYDGSVFKKAEEDVLSDRNNLAFLWSSDGVVPYESADQDIWPFFLVNILLPPEKRFKRENVLLAAVYVGKTKPHPNVFLKHVHDNVKLLEQGFEVMVPDQAEPLRVKCCVLCGTCDSPAKALLFNQKYYSGFYSCPKCLSKGEKSDESEDVFVHPFQEDVVIRTDEDYEQCAQEAALLNQNAPKSRRVAPHGIKGPSFLYLIVNSMIISTSIDTMHCVYLGIMRQCLTLWFGKSHRHEQWSLYSVRKLVSNLLLKIKPPHFVKRMPQSLDHQAKLKAYELLLMFYFYLLPILKGVMKQPYYHNFKLLVSGMSLLNKRSVSESDVGLARILLKQFAKDFQQLYSVRNMSFNIHLVTHVASVVEALGPLNFTTCFKLEGLNGLISSLIHGSRYAGSQIVSGLFVFLNLPKLIESLEDGHVKKFCVSLVKRTKRVNVNEKISVRLCSVGKYSKLDNIPPWMVNTLLNYNFNTLFSFQRILWNGFVITSENYLRSEKTCSHFVCYKKNNSMHYGLVKMYCKLSNCFCVKKCKCSGQFFAFICKCTVETAFSTANPPSEIEHIHSYVQSEEVDMVPVECVTSICFHLDVNGSFYVCDPLNDDEMYN